LVIFLDPTSEMMYWQIEDDIDVVAEIDVVEHGTVGLVSVLGL
jgi:hypothetical protein